MNANETFSKRLAMLRQNANETQEVLCKELHITRGAYSTYEHGTEASYDVLCSIADHYHVSVDYLLGRSEDFTALSLAQESLRKRERELHSAEMKLRYTAHQLRRRAEEATQILTNSNLCVPPPDYTALANVGNLDA